MSTWKGLSAQVRSGVCVCVCVCVGGGGGGVLDAAGQAALTSPLDRGMQLLLIRKSIWVGHQIVYVVHWKRAGTNVCVKGVGGWGGGAAYNPSVSVFTQINMAHSEGGGAGTNLSPTDSFETHHLNIFVGSVDNEHIPTQIRKLKTLLLNFNPSVPWTCLHVFIHWTQGLRWLKY